MNSQEEDQKEIKQTYQQILAQLKAYGEDKRVRRVKDFALNISNGLVDPVVRSVSASIGNQ